MSLLVVVPSNRPLEVESFLRAWGDLFEKHEAQVCVVHDQLGAGGRRRADIPDFIPQATGAIRSWGFLRAWREGMDVLCLDDDCMPASDVDLIREYESASDYEWSVSDYFDVGNAFGMDDYMRGFPFAHRDRAFPLIQYGGWDNVPDFDAVTQAAHELMDPVEGYRFDRRVLAVPLGVAVTTCGMNVWISHAATPLMYQLQMGVALVGFDRYDDLWSGLFAKRICDHLELPILINGRASVVHSRASDTASNFAKESGGYALNDALWGHLRGVQFYADTPIACYRELTEQLDPGWFGPRGRIIIEGMRGWLGALHA